MAIEGEIGPIAAIDAAGSRTILAIAATGGRREAVAIGQGPADRRRIVAELAGALGRLGLRPADVASWACVVGPGSFTGLRVALTAAKTLAYVGGRPLIVLDSLESLAWAAGDDGLKVAAAIDAQRGDAFVAEFARDRPGSTLRRVGPTRIESLHGWIAGLAAGTVVVVDGPPDSAIDREGLTTSVPEVDSRGSALLALAARELRAGRSTSPWFAEPVYLRRSAAEEKADRIAAS